MPSKAADAMLRVMPPAQPPLGPLAMPVEALDLFAQLLSDAEAGTSEQFYSRMAAATCRVAALRRAVLFAYDDERRMVRAMGAHGIDLQLFAGASPTAEQVAVARRALADDTVVEVTSDIERELPEEFHPLLMHGILICIPMSAGGRWIGVIIGDRAAEVGALNEGQRYSLWSLGKVAALAAAARNATREHELARQLSDRIDFARDLHEVVVQRLFGVSLALSHEGPLSAEHRERCREEIQAALRELRAALQRPLASTSRATATTLHDELDRLRRAHRDIDVAFVDGREVDVPDRLEPVAQSVLREAVRNAAKHADPKCIEVRVRNAGGAFVLEIINDGVTVEDGPRTAGMGLRLAAFEALESGGVVEFGPEGDRRWRVRLTVPVAREAPVE
jgi:signal transduction histidine kinase